jgi:Ca2+/Na+ antiporter
MAGIDLTESFNVTFGIGFSKFDFNINNESQRLEVHFNFIALALIIFIEKMKKQLKEEQDKNQISSIATI